MSSFMWTAITIHMSIVICRFARLWGFLVLIMSTFRLRCTIFTIPFTYMAIVVWCWLNKELTFTLSVITYRLHFVYHSKTHLKKRNINRNDDMQKQENSSSGTRGDTSRNLHQNIPPLEKPTHLNSNCIIHVASRIFEYMDHSFHVTCFQSFTVILSHIAWNQSFILWLSNLLYL